MMNLLLIFSSCLLFAFPQIKQDPQLLMKEAAADELKMRDEEAYRKYQQVVKLQPANLTALCKCSELASKIGHRQPGKENQVKYFKTAKIYAQKALDQNASSAEANFVMSLAMGRMAMVSSGKTLVESVKGIKIYADRTVASAPGDFRGYHVLGKWYFEISNLGSFKRSAVKLFYGAFPDASFEDARRNYAKSLQLKPDFNLNYLELAKVYQKMDKPEEAISLLNKLINLPLKMEDDQRIRQEGKNLLAKLKAEN